MKTIYHASGSVNDFGIRIRFKCHQEIQRTAKTSEGELCTNWELIDSFGVRLDINDYYYYYDDGYEKFYDDLRDHPWWDLGNGL